MFISSDGLKIYYEVKGQGEPLFLLHGWGANSQTMRPLLDFFSGDNRVYSFDFPGFGRSDTPPEAWGSQEYAALLYDIQRQLNIPKIDVIAHSFGGRAAIILAATHPESINKLILTGSAGLPPKRKPDYYIKVYFAKLCRNILSLFGEAGQKIYHKIIKMTGSSDYSSANPQMRKILVKVVNENLTDYLPKIHAPVLLVWGEADTATPLEMGQFMEKAIANSKLIVFPKSGHFAYLEKLGEFCELAANFLK